MTTLDKATIDKLKTDHGDVTKVRAKTGEVFVLRTPSRGEWRRFSEQRMDEKKRLSAAEALVRHTVVFPSGPELEAVLEKRPGLLDQLSIKAAELAGASEEFEEEKL